MYILFTLKDAELPASFLIVYWAQWKFYV